MQHTNTQNIHTCLQGCHWNSIHNSTLCPYSILSTTVCKWCLWLPLLEDSIQILFLIVEQATNCDSNTLTCSVCSLMLYALVCDCYIWLHVVWYLASLLFILFLSLNCMYCALTVSFSSGSAVKILLHLKLWHYSKLCVAQYWDSLYYFILLNCTLHHVYLH